MNVETAQKKLKEIQDLGRFTGIEWLAAAVSWLLSDRMEQIREEAERCIRAKSDASQMPNQ